MLQILLGYILWFKDDHVGWPVSDLEENTVDAIKKLKNVANLLAFHLFPFVLQSSNWITRVKNMKRVLCIVEY